MRSREYHHMNLRKRYKLWSIDLKNIHRNRKRDYYYLYGKFGVGTIKKLLK